MSWLLSLPPEYVTGAARIAVYDREAADSGPRSPRDAHAHSFSRGQHRVLSQGTANGQLGAKPQKGLHQAVIASTDAGDDLDPVRHIGPRPSTAGV